MRNIWGNVPLTDRTLFAGKPQDNTASHPDPVEQLTTRSNFLQPVGEVTAFLLLAFLLHFLEIVDLGATQPHPFWAVIIWAGLRYRVTAAIATTALTITLYFAIVSPTLGSARSDWISAGVLPLLWLVCVIGLVQAKAFFYLALHGTQQKFVELGRSFNILAAHAEKTAQRAHQLELASRKQSQALVSMLQSVKLLKSEREEVVIKGIRLLVHGMLSPTKFSLFRLDGSALILVDKSGWLAQDTYLSTIDAGSPLFSAVVDNKTTLCVADRNAESALDKQGLLAGPLTNETTGQVVGMLKIEEIPFQAFDHVTVEMFRLLCLEVGAVLTDLQAKTDAIEGQNTARALNGPSAEEFVTQLGQRLGFGSTRLIVQLNAPNGIAERLRPEITQIVRRALSETLRLTDIALDSEPENWSFSVLLSGTPEKQAREVSKRITDRLTGDLKALSPRIETSISIFPLISHPHTRRTKAA